MSYTTTELAKLTGYTPSTIIKTLEMSGYTTLEIEHHGLKVWDDECLPLLLDKKRKSLEKTSIAIVTLSQKTGLQFSEIRKILTEKNIKPLGRKEKYDIYPYSALEALFNYIADHKTDKEDEHPLVTDKRCLTVTWFPEIVPKCFEDLDEDFA